MKRIVLAAGVVLGLACASPAQAQFVYGGIGYHGGYWFRGPVFVPPVPFWGWGPGWAPGVGNPFFLPPPAGLGPPVIVVPPPIILAGGLPNNPLAGNPFPIDPAPAPAVQANPVPPGARPGEFLVISPRRNVAQPGEVQPKLERVVPPAPPPPRVDPFAPPRDGNVERVEADPTKESARLVQLARKAFADGEYGRAAVQFDRAIRANKEESLPHFLKAQARFATGQYSDAVAAIRLGMRLAPDWPTSGFRPKDLYGVNAERFDAHLAALRRALADHPNQAALEFLLGYELWFTGDRPAATVLFRAAAKHSPGNPMIERFLREADGRPGPR